MKKKEHDKIPVGEKITDALDLPRDAALNTPRITLWANRDAEILNHKGIIEYDNRTIRLNSSLGIITVEGENLDIKSITDDDISVSGKIKKIEI